MSEMKRVGFKVDKKVDFEGSVEKVERTQSSTSVVEHPGKAVEL